LDGRFVRSYSDGTTKYKATYRDGLLVDTSYTYYPSGAIETMTTYASRCNEVLSSVAYALDGKVTYLYTSLSPYSFDFWENGAIRRVSLLKHGKHPVWYNEYDPKTGKLLRQIDSR
jgi:antitoxin component YwqK of YwqJK toxin-antitoxin module